ncbi:MAG: nucleoside phosphorylase [Bacteroidota bacterium]|nr:nucleoside phosphorylase [Bacteroidota bacterium]
MEKLKESQLIINPDGSIYHLSLRPGQLADTVLLVGDPGRVEKISDRFDKIEYKVNNREMFTHTGYKNGRRLSVISTGIGPDNIDIVLNELDALVNIDFGKRMPKEKHSRLNLIRIGTSGTIQPDIPINSFGLATHGLGLDGMFYYYDAIDKVQEQNITDRFIESTGWPAKLPRPYVVKGSSELQKLLGEGMYQGITATAPGFYAPQGRSLRLPPKYSGLNEKIAGFSYNDLRVINFEMETSALYGLGKALGHNAITVCAIIANRAKELYSKNPARPIEELIDTVLERITV